MITKVIVVLFSGWVLIGAFIGLGLIFAHLMYSKGKGSSKKKILFWKIF